MNSKNIIITGTSRGIGNALVSYFIKQNYQVLAISRDSSKFNEDQNKCENFFTVEAEITEESGIERISNFVSKNWKQVDVLIHNAGMLILKPFLEASQKDFMDTYRVNVFAVARLNQVLIPFMNKGSHVVAISSMGGIQGSMKFPGLATYSSSKGALITLMELLAEEFKESGISFNTLALGAVQTEMLKEAFPDYQAPVSAEEMAEYIGNFSLMGNLVYNGKVLQVANTTP